MLLNDTLVSMKKVKQLDINTDRLINDNNFKHKCDPGSELKIINTSD